MFPMIKFILEMILEYFKVRSIAIYFYLFVCFDFKNEGALDVMVFEDDYGSRLLGKEAAS